MVCLWLFFIACFTFVSVLTVIGERTNCVGVFEECLEKVKNVSNCICASVNEKTGHQEINTFTSL